MTTALAHRPPAEIVVSTFAPAQYPIDKHPALVYLAKLQPGSQDAMRGALDVIAQVATDGTCDHVTMPWHELRYHHTEAIRARLVEIYSPRTVNKQLSALRQVLKRCWRLGWIEPERDKETGEIIASPAELHLRAADIENVKNTGPAQAESGRALELGEFMALVAVCNDGTQAGSRDAAIIGVGYACGLRRSELAGLTVADYDAQAGTLTIHGKGNKTRVVPIANGAKAALDDWLAIRGDMPGAMFLRIRKGDKLTDAGLTSQAIYTILHSRAESAGVKDFSPHDLRRTYAGDLLDAGADIVTVQKLMGHSSVSTTGGYDRRDGRAKKAAAAKLHYPYKRRA